ncbi:MAG: ATP-binding protein [Euryarchaeota archaeon]|nr:ATP-binding protein [Euryarchaeota archaeon]MBU4491342.1 ATP-binding protein [Euryarchaeota archaeon]
MMLETLMKVNEWWETKEIPKELVPETKRNVFSEIVDMMDDRRIIAIVGPRRTGKTTTMFQLMDMLIKEKRVNPKNILFFSCDDVDLRGREDLIGEAIRLYFEEFLKLDYRAEKCYIFIDEIHWIKDWQLWLKKFYDLKYNIKFIISGSSAAKIKKEQRESLAGRIMEFTVFPMTFSEFLGFCGIKIDKIPLDQITYEKLKAVREELGPKRVLEIKKLLDEYLIVGGLPEWFETKNLVKWQKKLREDVIKRVVYDDIATLYGVKNTSKIEALLMLISSLQSRIYSYNSIASTLKIDNETAAQYISYLKESFILFELRNYAASKEKQLRKNYKYVIFDSGIRNSLERINDLRKGDTGYILESAVGQHFVWNTDMEPTEVFYWREKELEVDFIVKGKNIIPIEVKYQSNISARDLNGLTRFMESFRITRGVLVTKELFEKRDVDGKEILLIPAWFFLLFWNFTSASGEASE